MTNIIVVATYNEERTTKWAVSFDNGETRSGTISSINAGIYRLTSGEGDYVFDSTKVTFIIKQ